LRFTEHVNHVIYFKNSVTISNIVCFNFKADFLIIATLKFNDVKFLLIIFSKSQMQENMFNKMVVYEALKRSLTPDPNRKLTSVSQAEGQDSIISLMVHDVFGGEILKTHNKKDWHFYNRINGERVDFTKSEEVKSVEDNRFEDIPSTPDETYDYFDLVDYSTFFTKFVSAFEETVGLEKYRTGLTT